MVAPKGSNLKSDDPTAPKVTAVLKASCCGEERPHEEKIDKIYFASPVGSIVGQQHFIVESVDDKAKEPELLSAMSLDADETRVD